MDFGLRSYVERVAGDTALLPTGIADLLGGAIPLFTFLCAWLFTTIRAADVTKSCGYRHRICMCSVDCSALVSDRGGQPGRCWLHDARVA